MVGFHIMNILNGMELRNLWLLITYVKFTLVFNNEEQYFQV